MSGIYLLNWNKLQPPFLPTLSNLRLEIIWVENVIQNITGSDSSVTQTPGITCIRHPWRLRVKSALFFIEWLLSYARVTLGTWIHSFLAEEFLVMKIITLNSHTGNLDGFFRIKVMRSWALWLSTSLAARQWLRGLAHPKIRLPDTNTRLALVQCSYNNMEHTCSATQVGPNISATWSTKAHALLSISYFVVDLSMTLAWENSLLWYRFSRIGNDWQGTYPGHSR